MNQRSVSLLLSALSLGVCIGIALLSPRGFIRGTLGDIVVVIFLYFLVQAVKRVNSSALACIVFLFGLGVEVLQALGVSSWLGLRKGSAAEVIVGSTFDWNDCAAYAAGVLFAWFLDGAVERRMQGAKQEK